MLYIIKEIYKIYYYYEQRKDMRTNHYFLMGSPFHVIGILAFYMYFVKNLGPKLMKNRRPFELKSVLVAYNVIQVIANIIITFGSLYALLSNPNHDVKCLIPDYSLSYNAIFEANFTYAYCMLKISDLFDTIFFVLRKKTNQVSFLHVYHHVFMVLGSYIVSRWLPGGHVGLIGILNGFVHIIMYSYYLITAYSPEFSKSIWWKKYITQIQIVQFTILIIHFLHPLLFGNCTYPKFWLFFGLVQSLFMFVLFGDFYYKAYIKKKTSKKTN